MILGNHQHRVFGGGTMSHKVARMMNRAISSFHRRAPRLEMQPHKYGEAVLAGFANRDPAAKVIKTWTIERQIFGTRACTSWDEAGIEFVGILTDCWLPPECLVLCRRQAESCTIRNVAADQQDYYISCRYDVAV